MLLKRFDVTIQSFLWSSRSEGKEEDIVQSIRKEQQHLTSQIVKYEVWMYVMFIYVLAMR